MSDAGAMPIGRLPFFLRRTLGYLTRPRFEYDRLVRVRPLSPTYLLASPEDVRHVLVANAANYVKTPFLTGPRGRARAGRGLLTSTGEDHHRRRRLLQPLFHRPAVARFGPLLDDRIERWCDARRPGQELDLAAAMAGLTRSVILAVLLGDDLDDDRLDRLAGAIEARRRYTELVYHGRLPLRERLPTSTVRDHRRALATLDGQIRAAIDRRRRRPADDLIGDLVALRGPDGSALSDDEIRDEALTFTSTGYETLGDGLAWAWYLLDRHPAAAERLRAEVDALVGDRHPTVADAGALDWTGAVLAESLRLYPPTWVYSRIPLADDVLPSGGRVGAGAELYVCPYVLHRHPTHFPDPERFDPGRFTGGARPPRFAYLPFGDGPHICLGEHLARLEGTLALARLGRRFRFAVVDPDRVRPRAGLTLQPTGLRVRVEPRRAGPTACRARTGHPLHCRP